MNNKCVTIYYKLITKKLNRYFDNYKIIREDIGDPLKSNSYTLN